MGWLTKLGALVTTAIASVVVTVLAPTAAWAGVLDEAARVRPRGVGRLGLFGTFCCLLVVAIVVVGLVLVARGRRRR